MHTAGWAFLLLFGALFEATTANANVITFNDRTSFLATSSVNTIDFEGIVPFNGAANYVYPFYQSLDPINISGVDFSGIITLQDGSKQSWFSIVGGSNVPFTVDGTASITGPYSYNLGAQGNQTGRLTVDLLGAYTAVAFDFNTDNRPEFPEFDFIGYLTNGDSFTAHAQRQSGFVGITSSTPFTGFFIDLPIPAQFNTITRLNIDNFSFGDATIPEPAPGLLIVTGALLLFVIRVRATQNSE